MMSQGKSVFEQTVESWAKYDYAKINSPIHWNDLPDLIQKAWIDEAREGFESRSPEIADLLKQLDKDIAELS